MHEDSALQLSKVFYKSHLFMQNKANFKKLPIVASSFTQTTYEKICRFCHPKNKANSKPNKANFKKRKNERKLFYTKGLRKNIGLFPPKKQGQNKPNFRKVKK